MIILFRYRRWFRPLPRMLILSCIPKYIYPSCLVPSLDQPELDHLSLCYHWQVSFARYGIARRVTPWKRREGRGGIVSVHFGTMILLTSHFPLSIYTRLRSCLVWIHRGDQPARFQRLLPSQTACLGSEWALTRPSPNHRFHRSLNRVIRFQSHGAFRGTRPPLNLHRGLQLSPNV
jgi:hypothetical protein